MAPMADATNILELFFSQSLDGFFFMMIDEPIRWDETADKEAVLDYVFEHQRITKINDAMLRQYGATSEQFLGITPAGLFAHDIAHGRDLWRRMFDLGRLHVESDERRMDGTPICIEGDYICFFDSNGAITGHFGIQRDVTERKRYSKRLELLQQMDRAILAARSVDEIVAVTLDHMRDLIPGSRVSVTTPNSPGKDEATSNALSIQMQTEGASIGTLNLDSDQPGTFTPEHIEIAHEVANSLAVAIRHTQLNEQIQRQNVYLSEELA